MYNEEEANDKLLKDIVEDLIPHIEFYLFNKYSIDKNSASENFCQKKFISFAFSGFVSDINYLEINNDALKYAFYAINRSHQEKLFFPNGFVEFISFFIDNIIEKLMYYGEHPIDNAGITSSILFYIEKYLLIINSTPFLVISQEMIRKNQNLPCSWEISKQAIHAIWKIADAIWIGVGDNSTDYNHYTKRATLSYVIMQCNKNLYNECKEISRKCYLYNKSNLHDQDHIKNYILQYSNHLSSSMYIIKNNAHKMIERIAFLGKLKHKINKKLKRNT